jgi:RsiW-degrading membrane proteinase PrsW (M82 family)
MTDRTRGHSKRLRLLTAICLWGLLIAGVLAMPAAILIGSEDGPIPADQLFRKKALARAVLLAGGGMTMLAACGLYATSRLDRPR